MTAALRGSRCTACEVTVFPGTEVCPRCGGDATAIELSATGRLWTWTVQRFEPKSPPYVRPPEGFQAFAVGYVELPEGLRVAAILEDIDLDVIRIAMPVRLTATTGVPRATPIEEPRERSSPAAASEGRP